MTRHVGLLLALLIAAAALFGATGCTKKKMMGGIDRPNHATHQAG